MKTTKIIVLLIILLFLTACENGITIYKDHDSLINENYNDVINELENQGFTNITYDSIDDLYSENDSNMNCIKEITVDGKNDFLKEKFSKDVEINILYHVTKKIKIDFNPSACRLKNFDDIVKKFKDLGFVNVFDVSKEIDNPDKDGMVYDVEIGGITNYKINDEFDAGAKILVKYYKSDNVECPFELGAIQSFSDFSNYYLLDIDAGLAYSWSDGQLGALKGTLTGSKEDGFIIKYSNDWIEKLYFSGNYGDKVILTDSEGYTYDDFISVKGNVIWKNNKTIIENSYTED